jgi:hypothetical protein
MTYATASCFMEAFPFLAFKCDVIGIRILELDVRFSAVRCHPMNSRSFQDCGIGRKQ